VLRRGVPASRVLLAPGGRHYITTQGQHTWSSASLSKQFCGSRHPTEFVLSKQVQKVVKEGVRDPDRTSASKIQRTEINTVKLEASRFIEKIFFRK
jgi:hypothetical protein